MEQHNDKGTKWDLANYRMETAYELVKLIKEYIKTRE